MKLRKLFSVIAAVSAVTACSTAVAYADIAVDDATGAITWAFNAPAEATALGGANTSAYYVYGETLSEGSYDTLEAAQAAAGENDLVIYNKNGSRTLNTVGGGKLYARYYQQIYATYTPAVDGTMTIVGDVPNAEILCTAGEAVNIACSWNYGSITSITFTPEAQTTPDAIYTIDASKTFSGEGYKGEATAVKFTVTVNTDADALNIGYGEVVQKIDTTIASGSTVVCGAIFDGIVSVENGIFDVTID